MSGAVAIFVKTPGHSPVKTRLAASVGEAFAIAWYLRAAAAVAEVASAAAGESAVVYWAVAETEASAAEAWQGLPTLAQGEGTLGARMGRVHHELVRRHGAGLLVGADAPQLAVASLRAALAWCDADEPRQVLGPARDGGFWLYGGNRAAPLTVWESVAYSVAETAAAFRAAFEPFGAWLAAEPLTDVDRGEDLAALRSELAGLAAPQPAQRALAAWLATCARDDATPAADEPSLAARGGRAASERDDRPSGRGAR